MAELQINDPPSDWRCAGEIWTGDSYHLNVLKSSKVRIENGEIEVVLPKRRITFSLDDIIEARTFRFPVRSLTLIFTFGEQVGLVSLFRLPRRAIEQFVSESDRSIIDERTWRTGFEAGRDKSQYGLQ